ncbi:hypothetical protein [Ralstonia pseudosolanacearum]|uniref:hypothetical protein n=1 Tax=Ralstonia pseudosolanacearum TaxID=1310165 RepID=UPI0018D04895|nr:hypothetical protein [Ralstonia pseudosolanacearum]
MSTSEGVSRIAKVIRGIGWLILAGGVLGFINGEANVQWLLLVVAAFIAAPCFAIAWIIDGFAKRTGG